MSYHLGATAPSRCPPNGELSLIRCTVNRARPAAQAPASTNVARLKSCRIFRGTRCGPKQMESMSSFNGAAPG